VFQERLYCIRYVSNEGRYYTAPTHQDLEREKRVIELLEDRFLEWQDKGYIPSTQIEEGYNTTQPIRERGWKYWHQLFNPRQLLVNGLFAKLSGEMSSNKKEKSIGLLGLNKIADWNSKLSIWNVGAGVETSQNTYTTQALNTLFNYGNRALENIYSTWMFRSEERRVG